MTGVLIRDRKREDTQRHTKEGNVKTEAEIGGMLPQVKECQEPPETGRGKEEVSPRVFRRNITLPTPC